MSRHISDEIRLRGLRVFGRHGVFEHERVDGQEFVIDVSVFTSLGRAAVSDDLTDTIDYGQLAERIVALVGTDPVNLLETLAQRIADDVLRDPRVDEVRVTVHKPHAPIPHSFEDVSITIHRGRE